MMLKVCARCGNVMPDNPSAYCDTCRPIILEERRERLERTRRRSNRKYNSKRDPKYTRFYNSIEWRTLSQWRLQQDGYRCRACGKIGTEVDHIEPIQTEEGWQRRLDPSNTQTLCHACHDEKHERFQRRKI